MSVTVTGRSAGVDTRKADAMAKRKGKMPQGKKPAPAKKPADVSAIAIDAAIVTTANKLFDAGMTIDANANKRLQLAVQCVSAAMIGLVHDARINQMPTWASV